MWSRQGYQSLHAVGLMALANADLYSGDGRAALARVEGEWPRLARSMFLRNELIRVTMLHLRARCALAAFSDGDPRGRALLSMAERDARRLGRERAAWALPLADVVRARLAHLRHDADETVRRLASALVGFEACDMDLYAASVRERLGVLLGGDGGREMRAQGAAAIATRRLPDPERMMALHAPQLRGVRGVTGPRTQ